MVAFSIVEGCGSPQGRAGQRRGLRTWHGVLSPPARKQGCWACGILLDLPRLAMYYISAFSFFDTLENGRK